MRVAGFYLGAALLLAEVIPTVLVTAFADTGFLSGLRCATCSRYRATFSGGQARWEIPQPLGQFSAQLLVPLAAGLLVPSDAPDADPNY